MNQSILTNSGGQGCIFNPSIPCKNESKGKNKKKSKSKKKSKREISKIVFRDESANREFKMNNLVRKIKGNEKWAVLWEHKCKTPSYRKLKKISEFDKCISKKKNLSKKKEYTMLKGPFGGEISYYAFVKMCTKSTFETNKSFINFFLELFSYMESLFIGLVELQKHKICHQDINWRNILFKNNNMYFIDFGLTSVFSNTREINKRFKIAYSNDRIYDAFPYDYTLYHSSINNSSSSELIKESQDFASGYYRVHHYDYLIVHEEILKKTDQNNQVGHHMLRILDNSYQEDPNIIIKGLDIYSLGMILPQILYEICVSKNVPISKLSKRCELVQIKDHLQLFRDMTEYHSRDRISAETALERYQEIQENHPYIPKRKSKSSKTTKTTKSTKSTKSSKSNRKSN